MDFVFKCRSCHGPLVAPTELRGRLVQCVHCACGTLAPDKPSTLTEALVDAFLADSPAERPHVLRRVRPPVKTVRFTSSRSRPAFPRSARISRDH